MSTLRTDANRPTAGQVIDGDRFSIELDLAPLADKLLMDIAVSLRHRNRRMQILQIGNPALDHATRLRIRNDLLAALAADGVFKHELTIGEAEALSGELFEAAEEPAFCEGPACEGADYATIGDLCPRDHEAASFRNALAGGRL